MLGLWPRRLGHTIDPTGRCVIPARAFVIRFPDGDFEYDLTRRERPAVGDTLRRRGSLWSVTRVTDGDVLTVHVDPAEVRAGGEGEEAGVPASP
jgi:hypothetical protein